MKLIIANSFIIISVLIMLIYAFKKNNNFINIKEIIKDHFKIFNGAGIHITIIYLIPMLLSIGIALKYTFNTSILESILVVISVIISALLAFQGIILSIFKSNKDEFCNDLIKQTNSSINFTVLINIFLIFVCLIYITIKNALCLNILTGIIVYFLLISFLTILIVMKRLRVLFKKDFKE